MINKQQRYMLWKGWHSPDSPLSHLPPEMIVQISTLVGHDSIGFKEALEHVGHGRLKELKAILDKVSKENIRELKTLLCNTGTVVTPAGLTVQDTTLLECAMLSGDTELTVMIKPYFLMFDGEAEMERQLERCRPCIDTMLEQKPEDLTWLFDIIKQASQQDVSEELKTDDEYNKEYQSALRNALNQWRQSKLDPTNRVIDMEKAPRMHWNFQNWMCVNQFLDDEQISNKWQDLMNGQNQNKIFLILRQMRGFIELTELPAWVRFALANSEEEMVSLTKTGTLFEPEIRKAYPQFTRSLKFKYKPSISFPDFDDASIKAHSGMGFDCFATSGNIGTHSRNWGAVRDLKKLYKKQAIILQKLCNNPKKENKLST